MLAPISRPIPFLHFDHYRRLPKLPPQLSSSEGRRKPGEKSHGISTRSDKAVADLYSSSRRSVSDENRLNELVSEIQSCSSLQDVRRAHAALLRLVGTLEIYFCNNLISCYAKLGRLKDAREVFDGMSDKNVVSWTALLNGYSRMGSNDEFWEVLKLMVDGNVEINSLTLCCILKFCGKVFDFEVGRQIHGFMIKKDRSNVILKSSLLYFYAQCGRISDAFTVFDRMERLDVVTWTTMITACAQTSEGNQALMMFLEMQDLGFRPNEFTVSSVLKACADEKGLRFGMQLHGAILKGMYPVDVFVESGLIGMYSKSNKVDDARTVFDMMPSRNTVTWTSMITGYAQHGRSEEAISLFHRMKARRILANSSTVVSILGACGSLRCLSLGKEIHTQIFKNHIDENNRHVGSTLVWFYCKCGLYSYAAKVLETMPTRDVITWTAIVSGHTQYGHDTEALELLNRMLREGVDPNDFTFTSALKACAGIEARREGQLIHGSVSKSGSDPNVYVGSALISLYMKCGCVDDAFRIFDGMPERNVVTWRTMVLGCAKNGFCKEGLKLMYRMKDQGFAIDDYVLSTVIDSCGGDDIFDAMSGLGGL